MKIYSWSPSLRWSQKDYGFLFGRTRKNVCPIPLKLSAWQWSARYFFHLGLQFQLDDYAKNKKKMVRKKIQIRNIIGCNLYIPTSSERNYYSSHLWKNGIHPWFWEEYLEETRPPRPGPDSSWFAFPFVLIGQGQQIQEISDLSFRERWRRCPFERTHQEILHVRKIWAMKCPIILNK